MLKEEGGIPCLWSRGEDGVEPREGIRTSFKMRCRGLKSAYRIPKRRSSNLSYRLWQVLRWALGNAEIFLSRRLKWLEQLAYANTLVCHLHLDPPPGILHHPHVSIQDLWPNQPFWVAGGVSTRLFAVFRGLKLHGLPPRRTLTRKTSSITSISSNGRASSSFPPCHHT